MSFIDHIRACNYHEPSNFIPFRIDGITVGRVRHAFAQALQRHPQVFAVSSTSVELAVASPDLNERSTRVAEVLVELVAEGVITHLHGEQYAATTTNRDTALLLLDRAAAPYFGTRAFGQHMNGFVRGRDGLKLWVARRSSDRVHYPGHLDNLVAGGLPYGVSLSDNLAKECREEAAIPGALAAQAIPIGALGYYADTEKGFKPDTLFCYDLELPADFRPRCTDGEVESFSLRPVEQVMETVRGSSEFKLNCNLVVIDFLIRHGVLGPEDEEYLALVSGLHPPEPPV
ncbi:MAG: DUF4743 domain-containing protein [Candidatus Sedimenticola sp. (ex Thyasira tokunagai)]